MKKKYKKIRRVIITGKKEEQERAFEYCIRNNYRVNRSGPISVSPGIYNFSRIKIIADKEI